MEKAKFVVVGGGTRSGKSAFAVRLGLALGARRAFVATALAFDDEMRARIDRHRRERDGAFTIVEEPIRLVDALAGLVGSCDVVVVDCVSHWLSNLLLRETPMESILEEVDRVVALLAERPFHAIFVTNEVGMSVHPETPLGRAFVEAAGWTHQRLGRAADEVHFAVLGRVFRIPDGG
jgi:adenosylcobinamide kinase/adenosylcobinamide-phosphate guanylyltransferase